MARNFDFEKYKSIVDYIKNTTGEITTSIDNLIKGSIELRKNSVASVIKYNTSIKEIVIGRISSVVGTDIWLTSGNISLDISNGGSISFTEDYIYESDVLLPSSINSNIITAIGTKYIRRSSGEVVLQREYDPSVTDFKDNDIPNLKYFKDNYVTKNNYKLFGKVILVSDSIKVEKSAVNKVMADKLSGSSIQKKIVDVGTTKVLSNFFDVLDDKTVSISSEPGVLTIGSGVKVLDAPNIKSLVVSSNVKSVAIMKDLSNLTSCNMKKGKDSNTNVSTDDIAEGLMVVAGVMSYPVCKIENTCQPEYSTNIIHSSLIKDSNSSKDKNDIELIEDVLKSTKDDFNINSISAPYSGIFSTAPSKLNVSNSDIGNARGNIASSLKIIYEMVAVRLLSENTGLFMDNNEFIDEHNISSILLKPDSSPSFNRRPILMSKVNDIGKIEDIGHILVGLSCEDSGGKKRNW